MIGKIIEKTRGLYASEDAAAMVEYALLLALIAMVSMVAIRSLGTGVAESYRQTAAGLP